MPAPRLLDIYEPVRKTQQPGVLLSIIKFLGFLQTWEPVLFTKGPSSPLFSYMGAVCDQVSPKKEELRPNPRPYAA